MSHSKLNNTNIFTQSLATAIPKYNSPHQVHSNKSGTNPFNEVFRDELNGVRRPDVQKWDQRKFMPLNKRNTIGYIENYIPNKNPEKLPEPSALSQYQMYKEDQLLSNPGGDDFFLNKQTKVINKSYDHNKFSKRIGKDLSDAGSNFVNVLKDIGIGAKIKYVDKNGVIKEGRKVGFLGTFANFFKNVASGLTFGAYTREGEVKPQGIGRIKHLFKKIFKDAVIKDIAMGVPRSVVHVGEDVMLAGLNAVEFIPDATIGNFKAGRKATTKIFDNTQVALDFVTDVIPGGEASGRTHSFKLAKGVKGLPVINNLTTPENGLNDPNWKYVRNTNFRKTIETLTSFIPFRI